MYHKLVLSMLSRQTRHVHAVIALSYRSVDTRSTINPPTCLRHILPWFYSFLAEFLGFCYLWETLSSHMQCLVAFQIVIEYIEFAYMPVMVVVLNRLIARYLAIRVS